TVYGGGGISPDFIVKSDKLTDFSASLLRKNVFYTYSLQYINGHGKDIQAKYGNDLRAYKKGFFISESGLKDFLDYAKTKGVTIDQKDLDKDKDYIFARLKAQIARNYWKNEGWYMVLLDADKQMVKAFTLFDKAKELVSSK
ncbi:MAG: S41 family peptidase, partial [Ignavibacteriales bacterium]|nr:S41 family peptidase [Ignavibacteriales bacterium]